MGYTLKIEVYKICNGKFVTPLAISPGSKTAKHYEGDLLFIIGNEVWVTNNDNIEDDEYSLAVYSPAFVRMNTTLFKKLKSV